MSYNGRICVSRVGDFIKLNLCEAHRSIYSIHPGTTKMYNDLRKHYWRSGIKRDLTNFVARYLFCHKVKA